MHFSPYRCLFEQPNASCFLRRSPIWKAFTMIFSSRQKPLLLKRCSAQHTGVTMFVVVLPLLFIFMGMSKTSSINTTPLKSRSFHARDHGLLFKEKSRCKNHRGMMIVLGAVTVFYKGSFHQSWRSLIIIGCLFYPFGNRFGQKALKEDSPAVLLFWRSLFGGVILLLFSFLFEDYAVPVSHYIAKNLFLLSVTGLFLFTIEKLLWYEGLKRLDLSKAVMMGHCYPPFSILFAFLFLKEVPTVFQLAGIVLIMSGVFFLTQHSKQLAPVKA